MYHEGMRHLQDERETRRLADRLEQVTVRDAFTDDDHAFIESRAMFFVATADADGRPECSYKGGLPGFVRVRAERIFPNCPRYIHRVRVEEHSAYVPRPAATPPVPDWKRYEAFRDALPERDRADPDDARDDT